MTNLKKGKIKKVNQGNLLVGLPSSFQKLNKICLPYKNKCILKNLVFNALETYYWKMLTFPCVLRTIYNEGNC